VAAPVDFGMTGSEPLPAGTSVHLGEGIAWVSDDILVGGSPTRLLRLSPSGRRALDEIEAGPVVSPGGAALGRLLTDAGLATVRSEAGAGFAGVAGTFHIPGMLGMPDVTVVVPVRDRDAELDRCLSAMGGLFPVVVVDDGSAKPVRVATIAACHQARLVRRPTAGGPAMARNTALRVVHSPLVAFLDSDCVAHPAWIQALASHFDDPLVGAVAPRVLGRSAGSNRHLGTSPLLPAKPKSRAWAPQLKGPAHRTSPLDMGPSSGSVAPRTARPYVPTAALLVRRAILLDGFDENLRFGEDVDLVWRLIDAGWRVRYDASVIVEHVEPAELSTLLARSYRYGASAAPLALRHPGRLAHVVLPPGPAATIGALAVGRPDVAGLAFTATAFTLWRRAQPAGLSLRAAVALSAKSVWRTWLGLGRSATQFALPTFGLAALATLLPHQWWARDHRRCTIWARRLGVASCLLVPTLADAERPIRRATPRSTIGALLERAAYGTGVLAGCWRHRTVAPLLPSTGKR